MKKRFGRSIFIIPFNGNLQGAIGLKDYETETRLMTARLSYDPKTQSQAPSALFGIPES